MKPVHVDAILNKLQIKVFCIIKLISLNPVFSETSKATVLKMKVDFGMV
jgi:hypothetical protein